MADRQSALERLWLRSFARERVTDVPVTVVACSGGRDSCVAAHLASRHGEGMVVLAYVDHGLRSAPEIKKDIESVEALAARLDRPSVILTIADDVARLRGSLGVEGAARVARYEALTGYAHSLLDTTDAARALIVSGHHLGDQRETLIMRLFSGRSAFDQLGMSARRSLSERVELLRPLLAAAPEEIDRYARRFKLPFVNDATNGDQRFLRNRIRHSVAPALSAIGTDWERALVEHGNEVDEMRATVWELMPAAVRGESVDGAHHWDRRALKEAPRGARVMSVRSALYALTPDRRVEARAIVEAVEGAVSSEGSASGTTDLCGFTIRVTPDAIRLEPSVVRPIQSGYLCVVARALRVDVHQPALSLNIPVDEADELWGPVRPPVIARDARAGDRLQRGGRSRRLGAGTAMIVEDRDGIALRVDHQGGLEPRDDVDRLEGTQPENLSHYIGLSLYPRKES